MSTFKPHWQVQPQSIRVSSSEIEQRISLSLQGDVDAPVFASSNPDIVQIDANGMVRCGSVAGNAIYVEASAPGFINWHSWRNVDSSSTDEMQIVLSPELIGQFARVVLQWGLNPRDLDSHLIGPTPAGGEFHVFYSHKIKNEAAELDVDDTSSYGPETITIYQLIPGTYR